MHKLHMSMRCYERFVEMFPENVAEAEVMIEHLLSHILLEFFEAIVIDEVSITLPSDGEQEASVVIRAQCESMSAPFLACDEEFLELSLEGSISCALVELLGTVGVDELTIR